MFADDGSRWALQLPYAANTGFFYARNNERTRHLFRSWLFHLEILYAAFGDQPVMNTILPEESSLTGLRVKVLKIEEFPCGNILYEPRYQDLRKDLLENKRNTTYMLNVNWTHKREKVGFVKQLGIYYVQEKCTEGQEVERITFNSAKSNASFMDTCCSSTPIGVRCHYPDKPSVISCLRNNRESSYSNTTTYSLSHSSGPSPVPLGTYYSAECVYSCMVVLSRTCSSVYRWIHIRK